MNATITDNLDRFQEICAKHQVWQLDVFGSAARDDFDHQKSDIDLLVAFADDLPGEAVLDSFYALEADLEDATGRKTDLHLQPKNEFQIAEIWRRVNAERKEIYESQSITTR